MSDGENRMDQIMDGIQSGSINLSSTSPTSDSESTPTEEPSQEPAEKSVVEEWNEWSAAEETEGEAEQELSAEGDSDDSQEASEATAKEESGDIEELTVKGPNGRQKKLKVDYSDKDKIKRAYRLAYEGRAVWQKERDEAKNQLSETRSELESLQKDWEKLETAYEKNGVAGLVDLLEGRDGAYQDYLKQEMQRQERLESMTDSERRAYEREQEIQAEKQRAAKLQEEYDKKLREIQEQQEQADIRALESKIHPSFDRYRFRGKLGDEVAETEFDEMLWNRALTSLEKISDSDVELTQGMVDKEFRRIASTIKKHLSSQVDKNLKKTVSRKKKDAAKKVRATVSRSMQGNQDLQEFRKNMKSGNLVDGLTSFFKAGGRLS